MEDKLMNAIHQAYTGESKASLRLKVYAEKADQEGYPQLAKLFRVISFSEELHGKRALRLLKEVRAPRKTWPRASNRRQRLRASPTTSS
jgi:rubrerythrin